MTDLHSINMAWCESVSACFAVSHLGPLSSMVALRSLAPLSNMAVMRSLDVSHCFSVSDLQPLRCAVVGSSNINSKHSRSLRERTDCP
jgi:hypothetical protein